MRATLLDELSSSQNLPSGDASVCVEAQRGAVPFLFDDAEGFQALAGIACVFRHPPHIRPHPPEDEPVRIDDLLVSEEPSPAILFAALDPSEARLGWRPAPQPGVRAAVPPASRSSRCRGDWLCSIRAQMYRR